MDETKQKRGIVAIIAGIVLLVSIFLFGGPGVPAAGLLSPRSGGGDGGGLLAPGDLTEFKATRTSYTASSTVTQNTLFHVVTTSTNDIVLTLPNAVGNENRAFIFADLTGFALTNNISLARATTTEAVNGGASTSIITNYGSARLYSDGSNWYTW